MLRSEIIQGDVRGVLAGMPAGSVQCVVTSPPYWALRDYGVDSQLGLEPTPEAYVENMVAVFKEVRRVLRDDGTVFCNMGDSYGAQQGKGFNAQVRMDDANRNVGRPNPYGAKQLMGIPWRLAFALQADGWYLRSDIIWAKCLSGGTRVYARTQKGEQPTTIKDLARLDPATVKLWNGTRWTQVLGMYSSDRGEAPLEVVLRNGERIGCTSAHRWPTVNRGVVSANELRKGDIIESVELPGLVGMRDAGIANDNVG
ncbi:MAG: DNA methyltransferase, partial [Planctomycetota bacterium]